MRRCPPTLDRLRTATAWLLALLCLWMGTGGVLHHTDDGPGFGSSSPLAAWGHATPAPADDGCAACQWTQGVQSGAFSVCLIVSPAIFVTPRATPLSDRLVTRAPLHGSPRAPPALLS